MTLFMAEDTQHTASHTLLSNSMDSVTGMFFMDVQGYTSISSLGAIGSIYFVVGKFYLGFAYIRFEMRFC